MESAGAAKMILQQNLSAQRLAEEIKGLANDPERVTVMGHAARRLSRGDAAAQVVDLIEGLLRGNEVSTTSR